MKFNVLSSDQQGRHVGSGEFTIRQGQPHAVHQSGEVIDEVQGLMKAETAPTVSLDTMFRDWQALVMAQVNCFQVWVSCKELPWQGRDQLHWSSQKLWTPEKQGKGDNGS